MSQAKDLADGTTRTGDEAIERGLADEKGDLNDAISAAAKTSSTEDPSPKAESDDPVTGVTEERSEEIAETLEQVEAESDRFEALVAENEELKAKLDALEAQSKESAEKKESDKISALIETAIKDGRIALHKEEEMKALAGELGAEKFEAFLGAIQTPSADEDLSTAPVSKTDVPVEDEDPFAPKTESEKELFARSPVLAKRYGL